MDARGDSAQLVVVVVPSAGLEALSIFVSSLARELPAPVVVVQQSTGTASDLTADILAARGPLPVETMRDEGDLLPGNVYVLPPGCRLDLERGRARTRAAAPGAERSFLEATLASAAVAYGEGLVTVFLDGTGTEGASGARAVKAGNGMVVLQNDAAPRSRSVPVAFAPSTVDIVADLDDLGALVVDLVAGVYAGDPGDQDDLLRSFLDELRDHSGIDFSVYKRPTILRRLQQRMASTGSGSLEDYIGYTRRNRDESQRLVSAFLIKVTEFFRDQDLFDYLRDDALPRMLPEARRRKELRLWSAGCATGEEAYSMAILISELLRDETQEITVRVFATDLDAEAISFARRGIYPATSLAALPPELVERYFNRIDGAFEVNRHIRGMVVFGQHDLGQRAPFPRIDVALCRNVLIYFTAELQRRALQLFAFSLRDNGYLVLGKAETVSPHPESFALEHPRLKVYRRVGERVMIPPSRIRESIPAPMPRSVPSRSTPIGLETALNRVLREPARPRAASEKLESILLRLPVGVVMVDRRYDVASINNAARRLLGVHTSAVGEDLIHLARTISADALRSAIDAAFRGTTTTETIEATLPQSTDGALLYVRFTCYPDRSDGDGDPIDAVILVVTDVTDQLRDRDRLEEARHRQQADIERMTTQVERLSVANRQLVEANQELTMANAELRGGNEELLVANEEVQAATEEVETLNEELQATNEELETLNEELQSTVEELNTTNDDLQARSVELQDLAVTLESQRIAAEADRAQLEAVLASMGDAILVIDPDGNPVIANSTFERTFGATDLPPVALSVDGEILPEEDTPQARAARGESFVMEFSVGDHDGSRRYEATGRPVTVTGTMMSGVLVIRDVTGRVPR